MTVNAGAQVLPQHTLHAQTKRDKCTNMHGDYVEK